MVLDIYDTGSYPVCDVSGVSYYHQCFLFNAGLVRDDIKRSIYRVT